MGKKRRQKLEARIVLAEAAASTDEGAGSKPTAAIFLPYLILFIFGFLLYANSISNKFAVDDTIVITENQYTLKGAAGIKDIFTTDAFEGFFGARGSKLVEGGRYRPLTIVSFAIEKELFGKNGYNPHISHAINALLYGLTGVLLFMLLQLMFPPGSVKEFYLTIPFLAAMLYIGHPIHTEAVANIKGRDEIIVFLFSMTTVWAALKYAQTNRLHFVLIGTLFFGLGLFSKENAITFLAIIPLTLYFFSKAKIRHYITTLVPLLAVFGIYMYLRSLFTDSGVGDESSEILNNPFAGATLLEQWATSFVTILIYFKLLIFPHPLSHDYYFNQVPLVGMDDLTAISSLILCVVLLVYSAIKFRKKDPIAYGILFFFITFSIVSNMVFTVGVTMSERFIYVSSFGFSLICAILLFRLITSIKSKRPASNSYLLVGGSILGILLLAYSVKTVTRNKDWHDNFSLFTHDVFISTNSAKLQTAAGGELIAESDRISDPNLKNEYLTRSIFHLNKALEIYPRHSNAWLLLGNGTYKLNNDIDEAARIYRQALSFRPGYYDALYNLGVILSERGRHAEAKPYFERALRSKPKQKECIYNLAVSYLGINQVDSCIAYANRVLSLYPNDARSYHLLGTAYGKHKNDLANAIPNFKKAISLSPGNIKFREDLGVAYGFSGDFQKAIEVFEDIIKNQPNNASAYMNLSITYRNIGNTAKADENYRKAVTLNPNYAQ